MVLRDNFNRQIDYLRLSVIDHCNLRCVYCMPGETWRCREIHRGLSLNTTIRFLHAARKYGLRKVRLTGGEPLLRNDIVDVVREIKTLGMEDLSLTTNGVLLAERAERLKQVGLDRINISLDSLNHERFSEMTGGGSLDAVLQGIHVAENAGFDPIKINMVPIRGLNESEIVNFAAMTLNKAVHIRFIELMPLGASMWGMHDRITSDETMKILSSTYGALIPCGDYGSSRNYKINGSRGVVGLISPMSRHFCNSCNRLRLKSDGRIRPCLFSCEEFQINNDEGRGSNKSIPTDTMARIGG
jgi:cyclic pyranopterin phosphate synthase